MPYGLESVYVGNQRTFGNLVLKLHRSLILLDALKSGLDNGFRFLLLDSSFGDLQLILGHFPGRLDSFSCLLRGLHLGFKHLGFLIENSNVMH